MVEQIVIWIITMKNIRLFYNSVVQIRKILPCSKAQDWGYDEINLNVGVQVTAYKTIKLVPAYGRA
jgi:hypothetical protein